MQFDAQVTATRHDQGLDGQMVMPADAVSLPYKFYSSGATRARHEEFKQRGRLTRELAALGLPSVYEFPKGVLIGQPVSTQQSELPAANTPASRVPGDKKADPNRLEAAPTGAWRRLRTRVLNPAHNPVMARNIRLKAQLAAAAARGAAAMKGPPSARLLRHVYALDEASRTIAKLQVAVSSAEPRRMSSAPISKPYYPRRQRGGVPANEVEGGNMWPGKLARRVAEQAAEEQQRVTTAAAAAGLRSPPAMERQRQIQDLADAILAAPNLGIHQLGTYLPHELHSGASSSVAATVEHSGGQHGHAGVTVAMVTPDLAEALRQLDLRAVAGRTAVTAAEDDYGSHYFGHATPGTHGTHAAIAIPVLSPVASSYGSGGHYMDEAQSMAEDFRMEGSGGSGHDGSDGGKEGSSDIADSEGSGRAEEPAASRPRSPFPDKVTVEENADAGLVVTRYPAGGAVWRQRAGGRRDAAVVMTQIATASTQGAVTLNEIDRMRLGLIQPGNEVTGGRQPQGPRAPGSAGVTPGSPANTRMVSARSEAATDQFPTSFPATTVAVEESSLGAQSAEVAAATAAGVMSAAAASKEESFVTPIAAAAGPDSAVAAAAAASEVQGADRAEGDGEEQGRKKVDAGRRQRTAVRAGPLTSAQVVKAARPVAGASDGISGAGAHGGAHPITQWGGAQIGRIVAVATSAVPASHTPLSPVSTATLPDDIAVISDRVAKALPTLPQATVGEGPGAVQAAARSAGPDASAGSRTDEVDLLVSLRAAAFLRRAGDGSTKDVDAGADGPNLDRFGMLSDVDSDGEEKLAKELDVGTDPEAHGSGRTDRNRPVQLRSGQAVPTRDDPWDSSSDDDNPWGIEDSDEMGYPLKSPDGMMVKSASAAIPVSKAFCVQVAAPSGQNSNNVDVGQVERKGPVDGGGSSNSSSAGSWGIRRHREGPGGAGSTAARETMREVAAKTSRTTVPGSRAEVMTTRNSLNVGDDGINLRQMFDLAADKERVVNPGDIPPLPLTTPPEWLVRPHGMEHIADGVQEVRNDGPRPSEALSAFSKGVTCLGRVEGALLHAQSSAPVRVVRHDSRTFYFSEPPSY